MASCVHCIFCTDMIYDRASVVHRELFFCDCLAYVPDQRLERIMCTFLQCVTIVCIYDLCVYGIISTFLLMFQHQIFYKKKKRHHCNENKHTVLNPVVFYLQFHGSFPQICPCKNKNKKGHKDIGGWQKRSENVLFSRKRLKIHVPTIEKEKQKWCKSW